VNALGRKLPRSAQPLLAGVLQELNDRAFSRAAPCAPSAATLR
jgi:hypothetical protein